MEFKYTYLTGIVMDEDLRKTILINKKGKLSTFTTKSDTNEISESICLTKFIFQSTDYQIEPDLWRLVVTIRRVDLESETKIFVAYTKLKFSEDSRYRIVNINKLDTTISPMYRWVLPLACDPSIVSSSYNQILIR